MDAKSRANFINSVANGQTIPCPSCGMQNKAEGKFCVSCGEELKVPSAENNTPAFAPITENVEQAEETVKVEQTKKAVKYVEPTNVFAEGLPSWSIEPPQVMVRRR